MLDCRGALCVCSSNHPQVFRGHAYPFEGRHALFVGGGGGFGVASSTRLPRFPAACAQPSRSPAPHIPPRHSFAPLLTSVLPWPGRACASLSLVSATRVASRPVIPLNVHSFSPRHPPPHPHRQNHQDAFDNLNQRGHQVSEWVGASVALHGNGVEHRLGLQLNLASG